MPESDANYVYGHERHILAQLLGEEETWLTPGQESAGDVIGPYMLVGLIGEGGFGSVWRAEQTRPVTRDVALKLLKRGMDSGQVLARFALERQVLATLRHPHIAALLDAGSTVDGRPFFVMEWVRGEDLIRYCHAHELPLRQKVELFKQVCSGVQHAHQKGIIHRDLKPSNILVTEVDATPVPKIIDFGIAKAVSTELAEMPMMTQQGHVMGTPLYMSPEQLSGLVDVDTRTDIYALGVLFYELLTGSLPYSGSSEHATNHEEMRRLIDRTRPVRPSVRLTEVLRARCAGTSPLGDIAGIPADLDWIILKALEPDRERRYVSAAALADDIQRFLKDEPVLARPPSFRYLAGRWVRRNRLVFSAALVSGIALVAGAGVALWQAHEARLAQAMAEAESKRALQAVTFLTAMLDRVAVEIGHGRNPEALKLALEGSAQQIAQLDKDLSLQAELFQRVGWLYETMGERKLAVPLIQAYAETLRRLHGPDSRVFWNARLGHIHLVVDHGNRAQALPLIEELLSQVEAVEGLGSEFWFSVQTQKISAYRKLRQPGKAKECALAALEVLRTKALAPTPLFFFKGSCVDAFQDARDYEEAERMAEELMAMCQTMPTLAEHRLWAEDKVLHIQRAKGDHARGAQILRERVRTMRQSPDSQAQDLIPQLLHLARFESDAKQWVEAITHAREAFEIARSLAPDSETLQNRESVQTLRQDMVQSLSVLARYESRAGKNQEALNDIREAFRIAEEGGHNTQISEVLLIMAELQERSGDLEAAYESYRQRYERSGQRGANYQRWHEDLHSMVTLRLKQNKADEALAIAQQLWQAESASPEARADVGHMRTAARLGLRCYERWRKTHPQAPLPKELQAWRQASGTTN